MIENNNELCELSRVLWELFNQTGEIGYYMFMQNIENSNVYNYDIEKNNSL